MSENLLVGLSLIIILGILAQWISWRFRLPSILLLLIAGFISGPYLGIIKPDSFFGELLFPIVSISVSVILFEGGLSLRLSELRSVGGVVRNLISVGILVTWILTSAAAYYIVHLELETSILIGAVLVVTGPTVILPLLRHVKPVGQINSILKWEGIVNDPIGAILSILVLEVIISAGIKEAALQVAFAILKTIILSTSIGLIGAYSIVYLLKQNLMPDFLHNAISLSFVIAVFTGSNLIQPESGLFAVTIMGVFLANQNIAVVRHIIEFKENLRILLISSLFIILSARLRISDFDILNFNSFLFVIALLFIIRPAAVYISSFGSKLNWKEKLYLSWMAPRGIVAAAISSLFAIELFNAGVKGSEQMVPLVFLVIVATITVYGLSAIPLAKWLGIANTNPQGCLILGAHPLSRAIGKVLQSKGIKVLLVDSNYHNIKAARMEDIPAFQGSVLSEYILNDIDLNGIGHLLAMTSNKEVNSLAAIYFSRVFGSKGVYQLSVEEREENKGKKVSTELRGQILFGIEYTYYYLADRFNSNKQVKSTNITEKFDYDSFLKKYDADTVIPFFIIDENKKLIIYTNENRPTPKKGQTLIGLFKENVEKPVELKS
ncbi:MAG: cation:proton antiporter [Ignavibacteriaceae bacterium]